MMKEQIVKRINEGVEIKEEVWETIPALYIQEFPWDKNGYKPVTGVKLFFTPTHLFIRFKVNEAEPKTTYCSMNEPVYRDSCVEFFFNPDPGRDKRYLNFEMNAAGTLLLGIGEDRLTREYIRDVNPQTFQIETTTDNPVFWSVTYSIPYTFIQKYYRDFKCVSGKIIRANFYKCGDDTQYPHYGCWNPIDSPEPDYHRPEYFGTLILE